MGNVSPANMHALLLPDVRGASQLLLTRHTSCSDSFAVYLVNEWSVNMQVLHLEGVVTSPRTAVTFGNTTVCQEHGVCCWHWHGQPSRDEPN